MAADNHEEEILAIWQHQETNTPQIALEQLRKRSMRFERFLRIRTIGGYAVCAFVVYQALRWFWFFPNPVQRVGAVLTLIGIFYMAWQLRRAAKRDKSPEAAVQSGSTPLLEFHRTMVERQIEFHSQPMLWKRLVMFVPGPLLFMVGMVRQHPEVARAILVTAIAFVTLIGIAIVVNYRIERAYKRMLDELDRLYRQR